MLNSNSHNNHNTHTCTNTSNNNYFSYTSNSNHKDKGRPLSPPSSASSVSSSPKRLASPPSSISPSHSFLQSPTHARSNSASLSDPSSYSEPCPSPELSSSTLMSFASGYNPHHLFSSTTTIAKPIAIYPQEHPQLKRFSPRFSTSGSSYIDYSTALASTFHQQQQIQLQLQQQQQQRRGNNRHDSLDKQGEFRPDQTSNSHNNIQPISRNHSIYNRSCNSPPTPCSFNDASTCGCSHQQGLHAALTNNYNNNSLSSSSSSLIDTSSTNMAQCSPILSHSRIPTVSDISQLSQSMPDPDFTPISLPSSTSVSSVSSPLSRSTRTHSLASEISTENSDCGYFLDTCPMSPSPSPPLLLQNNQLIGFENQQMQRHTQQHLLQTRQSRRRQTKKSLISVAGDQSAQTTTEFHRHHKRTQADPATLTSTLHHSLSHSSNNHSSRAIKSSGHSSRQSSKSLTHPSPSSSQAIALSSSRYIRFLWLPLLPLLILAVGGQTSAKFESPVSYTV